MWLRSSVFIDNCYWRTRFFFFLNKYSTYLPFFVVNDGVNEINIKFDFQFLSRTISFPSVRCNSSIYQINKFFNWNIVQISISMQHQMEKPEKQLQRASFTAIMCNKIVGLRSRDVLLLDEFYELNRNFYIFQWKIADLHSLNITSGFNAIHTFVDATKQILWKYDVWWWWNGFI